MQDEERSSASPPTIAIATALHVPPRAPKAIVCSITKWCHNAGVLSRALTLQLGLRASIVILTNRVKDLSSECHARVVHTEANLSATIDAWATHVEGKAHNAAARGHYLRAWLRKWQLVSMIEFDAILYSDADVDLLGGAYNTSMHLDAAGARHFDALGSLEAAMHAWRARVPSFLADHRAQLLAPNDREIVTHGGVFLVKPRIATYELGVDTLRSR